MERNMPRPHTNSEFDAHGSAQGIWHLVGITPIFGGSARCAEDARQSPAFHPDMMGDYSPHFLAAIANAMDQVGAACRYERADVGAETWALAAAAGSPGPAAERA